MSNSAVGGNHWPVEREKIRIDQSSKIVENSFSEAATPMPIVCAPAWRQPLQATLAGQIPNDPASF
jgi:hypothetical protein